MISTRLRWPLVVILSGAILAGLVAGGVHSPARVVLSLWFLLVCTGMAFVPLLRIREPLVELGVGVVASIALDTVVTTVILLAGGLSATSGFVALGALCLVGCAAQVATAARRPRVPSKAAGAGVSSRPDALLTDLATAATLLVDDLRHGRTLDAYLRAAGMTQVSADHLHAEIYPLDRAAALLGASLPRLGAATTATANAVRAVRARGSSMRRVRRWHGKLSGLVEVLARDLRGGADARSSSRLAMAAALAAELATLPATLRTAVIKLPACFCTFDQQPADLDLLVSRFAERHPERDRTLLIVGVRTSGSYLAPLGAAALRSSGYRDVRTLTVRPGRALLDVERDHVRTVARRGGLALLVDDPPVSGASVARAALALRRAGLAPDAIVLLLAQSDPSAVAPPVLASYETVVLSADHWTVRTRLAPDAVASTLSHLVGDRLSVLTVTPACLPDAPARRGHVRALFAVGMRDLATGARVDADILVEGVGLGFLGLHALPADRGLQRFAPTIFGLSDGLLYREWLPDDRRVGRVDHAGEQAIVGPIAEYVATRRRTLPAGADLSLRQSGENPAWEVASATLSRVFGRAWPLAKVVLIDRAVKRMLLVARPSIVDGNTDLAQWFYDNGRGGSLVKVDAGENRFSNMGLSCFDAAFDLAGVTARTDSPSLSRRLRQRHAELTNEHVDEERWLLYELAHLWGRGRTRADTESELRRARARALQRYFGDVYFAGLGAPASGPLCALDVDGVLETEQLGFPALTPAAALALRALALHGYRTVLATGRSLDDVIVRCRHYPLSGGAAEYGSAVYDSRTDSGVDVVSPKSRAALDRLRAALAGTAGVHVDDGYRRSVRAFAIQHGHRVALPPAVVAVVLRSADVAGVRVVAGDGQTDFVAGEVDKGAGVHALLTALGEPRRTDFDRPLALAVGDSESDASLAPLADRAFAPAHAPGALRAAGFELTSRPYQAGLAQAVGALIGHAPGTCDGCRMPPMTAERRILLSMLQAPERRTLGLAIQALKLAGVVAQARPKAIRHEEAA